MAIIKYDDVKEKPSTLRAMTSLDREEFEELCVTFGEAWERQRQAAGYDPSQGGRPPQLAAIEDKLLFILFYLKTYPLQEVQGHVFGLSQGQANVWIHRLSEVLKETLKAQGHLPARLPAEMLARYLAGKLREELLSLGGDRLTALAIGVEESIGQTAWYRERLTK